MLNCIQICSIQFFAGVAIAFQHRSTKNGILIELLSSMPSSGATVLWGNLHLAPSQSLHVSWSAVTENTACLEATSITTQVTAHHPRCPMLQPCCPSNVIQAGWSRIFSLDLLFYFLSQLCFNARSWPLSKVLQSLSLAYLKKYAKVLNEDGSSAQVKAFKIICGQDTVEGKLAPLQGSGGHH